MYLLDTNVISELRRSDRANAQVLAWANSVLSTDLFTSAITVFELERGVLTLERRDARQGGLLRKWLDGYVFPTFADRILPVDTTVARRCAALHVPNPRPERDAFIAATAMVHGFTLVTRNVADFEPMSVALFNPWD